MSRSMTLKALGLMLMMALLSAYIITKQQDAVEALPLRQTQAEDDSHRNIPIAEAHRSEVTRREQGLLLRPTFLTASPRIPAAENFILRRRRVHSLVTIRVTDTSTVDSAIELAVRALFILPRATVIITPSSHVLYSALSHALWQRGDAVRLWGRIEISPLRFGNGNNEALGHIAAVDWGEQRHEWDRVLMLSATHCTAVAQPGHTLTGRYLTRADWAIAAAPERWRRQPPSADTETDTVLDDTGSTAATTLQTLYQKHSTPDAHAAADLCRRPHRQGSLPKFEFAALILIGPSPSSTWRTIVDTMLASLTFCPECFVSVWRPDAQLRASLATKKARDFVPRYYWSSLALTGLDDAIGRDSTVVVPRIIFFDHGIEPMSFGFDQLPVGCGRWNHLRLAVGSNLSEVMSSLGRCAAHASVQLEPSVVLEVNASRINTLAEARALLHANLSPAARYVSGVETDEPQWPLRQALRLSRLNEVAAASMLPSAKERLWCDPISTVGCALQPGLVHRPLKGRCQLDAGPMWHLRRPRGGEPRKHVPVVVAMTMNDVTPSVVVDHALLWHHYCQTCMLAIAVSQSHLAVVSRILNELKLVNHTRLYVPRAAGSSKLPPKILFLLRSLQLGFTWDRVLMSASNDGPFRHGIAEYLLNHTTLDVQDVHSGPAESLDPSRGFEERVTLGTAPRFVSAPFALVHDTSVRNNDDRLLWFDAIHQRCAPYWTGVARAGLAIGTSPIGFEGSWLTWDEWRLIDRVAGTVEDWSIPHMEHSMFLSAFARYTSLQNTTTTKMGLNTAQFFWSTPRQPLLEYIRQFIESPPPHKFTVKRISKHYYGATRAFLRERRGGNPASPALLEQLQKENMQEIYRQLGTTMF